MPAIDGKRGQPRRRPLAVYADRSYDQDSYRRLVRDKGVTPVIARRGTTYGSGPGKIRWVVEQTFALLHWFPGSASGGRSATTSTKHSSNSAAP